jgi:hypothetical protein
VVADPGVGPIRITDGGRRLSLSARPRPRPDGVVRRPVLPTVRRTLGADGTLAAGAVVLADVLVVLATVRIPRLGAVVLLPGAVACIGVLSTAQRGLPVQAAELGQGPGTRRSSPGLPGWAGTARTRLCGPRIRAAPSAGGSTRTATSRSGSSSTTWSPRGRSISPSTTAGSRRPTAVTRSWPEACSWRAPHRGHARLRRRSGTCGARGGRAARAARAMSAACGRRTDVPQQRCAKWCAAQGSSPAGKAACLHRQELRPPESRVVKRT